VTRGGQISAFPADIAAILRTSEERYGREARTRYQALLTAAMRRVAAEPDGALTADRSVLLPGVRSFHLRHSRNDGAEPPVARPVHVIFYRPLLPGVVEIVRVLHERMEPSWRLGVHSGSESAR
jgi:toxin ParE1/3/4